MRSIAPCTVLAVLLASGLAGCPNPTQRSLLRAQKALEDCNLREAHGHFDDAFASSPDDVDAAIGFALTDIVLLAEDPNVTRILMDLGAEGPIDMETFFYGEDALLERLAESGQCTRFVEQTLPYAPLRDDDIAPLSLIDPELTIEELLVDLKKVDGRLSRVADAFEAAATHLEEPYTVALEGSCGAGLGEVVLDTPELFGAAAVLQALRAVVQAADGYDWDMTIHDLASEDDARSVDTCNAHLLHLTDPAAVAAAGDTLLRAIDLADRGLADAIAIEGPSGNRLFAWHLLDEQMVAEARAFGDAARASLETGDFETIPFWTPELGANPGALFSSPPDAGALDRPLLRLVTYTDYGEEYSWTEVNTKQLEALFGGYFDREVFRSNDDEHLDLEWEQDLEPILNPGGRYDGYYCD